MEELNFNETSCCILNPIFFISHLKPKQISILMHGYYFFKGVLTTSASLCQLMDRHTHMRNQHGAMPYHGFRHQHNSQTVPGPPGLTIVSPYFLLRLVGFGFLLFLIFFISSSLGTLGTDTFREGFVLMLSSTSS